MAYAYICDRQRILETEVRVIKQPQMAVESGNKRNEEHMYTRNLVPVRMHRYRGATKYLTLT